MYRHLYIILYAIIKATMSALQTIFCNRYNVMEKMYHTRNLKIYTSEYIKYKYGF